MPLFPIEYTAKSTVHQRQLVHIEADSLQEAIAAVEGYEFDNGQADDLGSPSFSEWLVDEVKEHDPDNSPHALPLPSAAPKQSVLYLASSIVFATDGAKVDLPDEMQVEVDAAIAEDQHRDHIVETIANRTGWLIESLIIQKVGEGVHVDKHLEASSG